MAINFEMSRALKLCSGRFGGGDDICVSPEGGTVDAAPDSCVLDVISSSGHKSVSRSSVFTPKKTKMKF